MSSPHHQQQEAQQEDHSRNQDVPSSTQGGDDGGEGSGNGDGKGGTTSGAPAPPQSLQQEQSSSNSGQQQEASQQQQPQHHQQQQQEPVNFNPRSSDSMNGHQSRRVTLGGGGSGGGGSMDRRGSLASLSFNMDDFFGGRRPSMGMDMGGGMDAFFGRRDSMDSTTAALDAAIFDLTRRRYSMAMGGGGGLGPGEMPPGPSGSSIGMGNSGGVSGGRREGLSLGMGGEGMNMSGSGGSYSPSPQMGLPHPLNPPQNSVANIAARQQQLQQQQRELEQRQKELELQRQQLIASMHERNLMMQQPPPMMGSSHSSSASSHQQGYGPSSYSSGGYHHNMNSGSLGLGSVHSHGSHGSGSVSTSMHSQRPSSAGSQQWWICQFCNTKAFASHEEAMQHETICPDRKLQSHSAGNLDLSMHSHSQHSRNDLSVSRTFSLGMDSSAASYENPCMSHGPFSVMDDPLPLAMPSDKDWLTPLHCFVRRHCVEVFTASQQDVATPSKGKRKPIQVGQVGIRCPHCHSKESSKARERGSVYYPTTISSIYNATMNLLQRHLHSCSAVPDDIMRRYETLKADDARSGTSKRYWVESALSLGLVDTPSGIRFSALQPPPLPSLTRQQESTGHSAGRRNSNEFFSSHSNAVTSAGKEGADASATTPTPTADEHTSSRAAEKEGIDADTTSPVVQDSKTEDAVKKENEVAEVPASDTIPKAEQEMAQSAPLVTPDDKPYATAFSYHLLSQMQPCVFTEADRLGKRKGLPPGFPGLACRHCFGGYGSGRFFPSSIKTLSDTSKTLNVLHNHMMRCRKCPAEVRESLEKLRGSHDEERAKMKFGSQKAFFARIWDRLHGKDAPPTAGIKRKAAPQPGNVNAGGMGGVPAYGMNSGPHQSMGYPHQMPPHHQQMQQMHHQMPPHHQQFPMQQQQQHPYAMQQMHHHHHHHPQHMPPQTALGPSGGLDALAMATDPKRHRTH